MNVKKEYKFPYLPISDISNCREISKKTDLFEFDPAKCCLS